MSLPEPETILPNEDWFLAMIVWFVAAPIAWGIAWIPYSILGMGIMVKELLLLGTVFGVLALNTYLRIIVNKERGRAYTCELLNRHTWRIIKIYWLVALCLAIHQMIFR